MSMASSTSDLTLKLKGIAAAPGLVDGPAVVWRKEPVKVPHQLGSNPTQEKVRLNTAIEASRLELHALRDKLAQEAHPAEAAVFDAHVMMLDDSSLSEKVNQTLNSTLNAEASWIDGVEFFAEQLASIPDPTLKTRAADLRDIGQRVLNHLLGHPTQAGLALTRPSVVIARDLAPSETVSLDKANVLAFCTAEGGPTSHTAILAKALGIPAVVGLGEKVLTLPDGAPLLVNGSAGELIAFPDQVARESFTISSYKARQIADVEMIRAHEPAITLDGHRVEIVANVGKTEDAVIALQNGAEGIGLLRTEFLFLERQIAPSEQEQLQEYDKILDVMADRPVVVRTIDVGGDKEIPYLDLGKEANPFLGWRAIRMCLDRPDFFKVQLRALLRSSPGHDLRIMFPMIATLPEVRQSKLLLEEARREVLQAGQPVAAKVQVGIMIEIPSAAVLAEHFAREVDFFSIGTNDLTQYTLAAERTNPKVAHLGDPCHPAVLRLIQSTISAGHNAGIWVGVCGEMAGDPEAVPVLLGMGLDEFSMSPRAIPHAKTTIRQWTYPTARVLAAEVVNLDTAESVRAKVRSHPVSGIA
jgi:phosphoenolpyruvate-protein phosphotransferase